MIYILYEIIRLYLFLYLAPIFNLFLPKHKIKQIYELYVDQVLIF